MSNLRAQRVLEIVLSLHGGPEQAIDRQAKGGHELGDFDWRSEWARRLIFLTELGKQNKKTPSLTVVGIID